MKGQTYSYSIHPVELDVDSTTEYSNMKKAIITPEEMRNGFNWDKKWEEHCICNTCENTCFDENMIVEKCNNYKEVKGDK